MLKNGYGFGGWIAATIPEAFHCQFRSAQPPLQGSEGMMHKALLVAMQEVGLSAPNPNVGCVISEGEKVVAHGATQIYGGWHGERVALELCRGKTLQDGHAFVLLEPCSHQGKQPPCVEALISAGIKHCSVAVEDPHHLVNGQGLATLKANGVRVEMGVLRNEAIAWNYPFFVSQAFNRPMVAAKWAQTLDGPLADGEGGSKWISSKSSRSYTHFLRQKYDAIAVGAPTVLADFPKLSVRDCRSPVNRQPLKVVVDPKGLVLEATPDQQDRLLQTTYTPDSKVLHVVAEGTDVEKSFLAERPQVHFLTCRKDDFLNHLLTQLMESAVVSLWGQPVQSIFVEGGARLLTAFVEADLVDVFHTFVNMSFMMSDSHRIGSSLLSQGRCEDRKRLKLLCTQQLEDDVLLEYVPIDRQLRFFSSEI